MKQSPYESLEGIVEKVIAEFKRDVSLVEGIRETVSEEDVKYKDFLDALPVYFELRGEFANELKTYFKAKFRRAPEESEAAKNGKARFVDQVMPMYFPVSLKDLGDYSEKRFADDAEFRKMAVSIVNSVINTKALNLVHYVGNVKNRLIDDLCNDAEHDGLTGFINKEHFHQRLAEETGRIDREMGLEDAVGKFSVIYLDIDNFKEINDKYSHSFGDETIKIIAELIKDATRGYDLKGRVGGEELVIYMPNTTAEEAGKKAEEIRKAILINCTSHLKAKKNDFDRKLTVSVGVATLRKENDSFNDIINDAEMAMYLIKAGSKNGTEVFNPSKTKEYAAARENYKGRSK